MTTVDVNCDLGEGAGHDEELMSLITSANIACGGHAGNAQTMRRAVMLAREHRVAIGAHPGYVDRENFGRVEMTCTPTEVAALVKQQIMALREIAHSLGADLMHVKPHGALYNQAARDQETARAIAQTVKDVDPRLILIGLSGGQLLAAGRAEGLVVAAEVFADRAYLSDGSLAPRSLPGAVIKDAALAAERLSRFCRDGVMDTLDGGRLTLDAQTVCVHGDGPTAVEVARVLREKLQTSGVKMAALAAKP